MSPTASWKRDKTATLTVTDPEGETATDTVTVTVSGRVKHVNAQSRKVTRSGSWRTRHGHGAADGNYMDNLGSGQGMDRMVFASSGHLKEVQSRVSRTVMKKTIGFVLALMLLFSGCRKTPKPTPEPKPQEKPKIQSFVSPTAEPGLQIAG